MRTIVVLGLLVAVSGLLGCKAGTLFAEQQWSHSYTQDPGVTANDPAVIDGDMNTVGQSVFPQDIDSSLRFPISETRIDLPEPKTLRKIIIHSSNLTAFEVHTRDNLGHWKKIKDVKGNKKKEIILTLAARTDSIRLRVKRTSDDAAQRRKNTERVEGGWTLIHGQIRAPALIQEVELYGFADAATDSPKSSGENDPIF